MLGDGPSRNPIDRDVIKSLPVPSGPVRRVIKDMFERPIEGVEEKAAFQKHLESLDPREP